MKLEYIKIGDYYYPNLKAESLPVLNKYGRARLTYLKENESGYYMKLQTERKLGEHLLVIQEQADDMRDLLTEQYKKARNITEEVKEKNRMLWVKEMNNIRNCVDEVIFHELIYR